MLHRYTTFGMARSDWEPKEICTRKSTFDSAMTVFRRLLMIPEAEYHAIRMRPCMGQMQLGIV